MSALQDGIFWQTGSRPGAHFKVIFLRVTRGLTAAELSVHLAALWRIWQDLRAGVVGELGEVAVPGSGLSVLLAMGSNIFRLDGVTRERPEALGPQNHFLSPQASGGGRLLPGGGLSYADDVTANPATEDLCLQLIADTPLAIHRAHVETWRYLRRHIDPRTGSPPLQIASFFDGFQREDRRSWLGFHDGISNLKKGEERRSVITVKPENAGFDAWTIGGTYLAFLRLPVDLTAWDAIPPPRQELLVGRQKGSGCPLVGAQDGRGIPMDSGGSPLRDPPAAVDATITASHVQRANHHHGPVSRVDSRRIYRQGYEFLTPGSGGLEVGLNFVSFQDDPRRCLFILETPDWLGGINFGGEDGEQDGLDRIISVRAAGVYFAPPVVAGEAFPGAGVLSG
ncbi:MAG: Dyp-type peroxidase family [Myxococcota bacterium]|jgi:Dyp-type peroxidase family